MIRLPLKLDRHYSCPCCRIMFAEQTLHAPKGAYHCTQSVHPVLHHCPFSRLKYNMVDILFIAPLVDDKAVANAKDGFSAKFCTHFGTESFGGNFATF